MRIIAVLLAAFAISAKAREVQVSVHAPWRTTVFSPVISAGEWLYDWNKQHFWEFVDNVADGGDLVGKFEEPSALDAHEHVLQRCVQLASGAMGADALAGRLLEATLRTNTWAPAYSYFDAVAVTRPEGCAEAAFVVVHPGNRGVCSVSDLEHAIEEAAAGGDDWQSHAASYGYVFPSGAVGAGAVTVVLHSVPGTVEFAAFHKALKQLAVSTKVQYVLQFRVPQTAYSDVTDLQGFGVFLDIKNMEYKNLNDDDRQQAATNDDQGPDAKQPENNADSTAEQKDLTDEEKKELTKDLGLQATTAIMTASDPLIALAQLSQNFPLHVDELTKTAVSDELRQEVFSNVHSHVDQLLPSSSLYINGKRVFLEGPAFNAFEILYAIRDEYQSVAQLQKMDLPTALQRDILRRALQIEDSQSRDGNVLRLDFGPGAKDALTFFNNLEKDVQYKRWPKQLARLAMPSWQLQPIGRNLYTFVLVIDASTDEALSALNLMEMMHAQMFPVRFAVVLVDDSHLQGWHQSVVPAATGPLNPLERPSGADIARLFASLRQEASSEVAVSFLFDLAHLAADEVALTRKAVVSTYAENFHRARKGEKSQSVWEKEAWSVLENGGQGEYLSNTTRWAASKGLGSNSYMMNGLMLDKFEYSQGMMMMLAREQQTLGALVQGGKLSDNTKSILSAILKSQPTISRFHPLLQKQVSGKDYIDFSHNSASVFKALADKFLVNVQDGEGDADGGNRHVADMIMIGFDPNVPHSRNFARHSLRAAQQQISATTASQSMPSLLILPLLNSEQLQCADATRQACPSLSPEAVDGMHTAVTIAAAVEHMRAHPSPDVVNSTIECLVSFLETLDDSQAQWTPELVTLLADFRAAEQAAGRVKALGELVAAASATLFESQPAQDFFSHNSRMMLLATFAQPVMAGDLSMFVDLEAKRMKPIHRLLKSGDHWTAPLVHSFVGKYTDRQRTDVEGALRSRVSQQSLIKLPAPETRTSSAADLIHLTVVVDPLSRATQRIASLLPILHRELGLSLTIALSPQLELESYPLQNFYRYLFNSAHTRQESTQARVKFEGLPKKLVLTARYDAPEPWNLQEFSASQDTDNLRCDAHMCGDAGSSLTSINYVLKNMLVAGQCFDATTMEPTNGLQLVIRRAPPAANPESADTLVMKIFGYFQLQANPGLWHIQLAEGRGRELFDIVDYKDPNMPVLEEGSLRSIRSFRDHVHHLRVRKKAGMEDVPLLTSELDEEGSVKQAATNAGNGVWNTLSSMWNNKDSAVPAKAANETIHVFSLATGHLYERLLKIMMLSVVKRASMPVKFWLFENFLSPKFKQTAFAMAEEYGFEIGLVTYKWPEWLRQQTEKQRIIWGYKILFLDVLFPLNVSKVIYVDADQVVRADLKELWEHDLQGKPYAYTPFCSSREETLGFQFWQSGYWKDHLRGKPYHISALYVVDLDQFRAGAIGDTLRGTYDALSRDPNSLANLDQDLPNFAQHVVPIHSLPQEWLWCESWCSDESKASAKTIDLCNNPMHKEPKLDMAKRVIKGPLFKESWEELDAEVRALETKLANN